MTNAYANLEPQPLKDSTMFDWPKHPDGRNKKFGELSPEQQRAVAQSAGNKLQAEANDPTSLFSRTCTAILNGPEPSRGRH